MNKRKQTLFGMLTSLVLLFSATSTAFADETLAGDKVVPCTVTFSITDTTYSYDGDIKVLMNDVTGTSNKSYTLTKANSYGSGNQPKFTVSAPTTYKIVFEGIKDGYQIVNSDDTKITDFPATANGYEFDWKIIYTDEKEKEVEKESEKVKGTTSTTGTKNTSDSNNNQNATSDKNDLEENNDSVENIENLRADEAFQQFLDSVSFIENDETWNAYGTGYLGNLFSDNAVNRAEDFVKVVKNATEEDYFNMSQYERFVYYESYVRIQKYINLGNWERYFSSKEVFNQRITSPVVKMMNATEENGTTVSDAYLKLMDWQYNYVQEHKAAFDFITGKDYIESGGEKADLEQEQKDKEKKQKAEKKELQEAQKEAGIWDDTKNKFAENILIILVVLGLTGGIAYITYQKKKNNKQ